MKLLIIEDEEDLRNPMVQYLKREGYLCEMAATFREGLQKIISYEYDCVIADLNLPGGDGLQLVKMVREHSSLTGLIIISARSEVEDRIKGLEEGADDYLTKPFHLSELNARIKAVLRRKTNEYGREIDLGDLVIRLDERTVIAGGEPLKLTKKEYDILLYLVRNKNRVVTKDSIAEHLWGDYMDDAASFDFIYAHVKNLRRKLADHGAGDHLKTIYGIGYKFTDH